MTMARARMGRVARGYEPEGMDGLKDAAAIHWSAKSGNASVCTTARDEAWLDAGAGKGDAAEPSRRGRRCSMGRCRRGYGWFKRDESRTGRNRRT